MSPTEALPILEGLVGALLRETSDTANNVGQEAARWLEGMKAEIRRLAATEDVRITGVNLDANADFVDVFATAIQKLLGCVFRNGDNAEVNYFRVSYQNTTAMTTTTSGGVIANVPVAAPGAANSPQYGFLLYPGGFNAGTITNPVSPNDGLSMFATNQDNLAVAGTGIADGSAWAVYTV